MAYQMPHAARYTEVAIRTASPLQLVVILYEGAIQCLREAQEHLRRSDIPSRVRSLNRAVGMISELQASLDFNGGGEIATLLNRLYGYMKQRLFEANVGQSTQSIAEVIQLLENLNSAWKQLAQSEKNQAQRAAAMETLALTGTEAARSLNISG